MTMLDARGWFAGFINDHTDERFLTPLIAWTEAPPPRPGTPPKHAVPELSAPLYGLCPGPLTGTIGHAESFPGFVGYLQGTTDARPTLGEVIPVRPNVSDFAKKAVPDRGQEH